MIARQTIEANSRTHNKSQPLSIIYVPIEKLKLNPENPRIHNKKQLRQIARSIKAFGFNVPILVDEKGQVVGGHGRVGAAKLLGISELPTIRLDHLTQTQVTAFAIADNRLTENARWNDKILAEQLKLLSETDLNFTVDVTGFEMGEVDVLIESLAPVCEGADDPADAIPETETARPVTKPGDLWLLGRHRVYCGNSLSESSFLALMQNSRSQVVITDPPYNQAVNSIRPNEFKMAAGETGGSDFVDFLSQVFGLLTSHSISGSLHYIFMDWRHMREILAAGNHAYAELMDVCIWVGNEGNTRSLYRSQHKLVFVFKSGQDKHRDNARPSQFRRHRTNVWNCSDVNSSSRTMEGGNLLELHPTVKPVSLVADAIMDCTSRHDVILDPFLGTGTTVIAAERTGRVCYGIELDPQYVDTIVRRWQAFTGLVATHAVSGRSFADLEQEAVNEQQ